MNRALGSDKIILSVALLVAGLALGVMAGCSGSSLGKTYPVKGKVVFRGGKPARGGTVELVSTTDPALRAFGDIEDDGSFTLTAFKDRKESPGVVEGEYQVFIELRVDRDERPGFDPDKAGGGRIALPGTRTIKSAEHDWIIEIPADGGAKK